MGRSTVAQLIQRAKNLNQYNNSGVDSDAMWVDHFNAALVEMVDNLDLQETFTIAYTKDTQLYTLPDDYYALLLLIDSKNQPITQKRNYNQSYPNGYWILDKGDHFDIDISYNTDDMLTILYNRYPKELIFADIQTQKPEVPTTGETSLCYLAISKALQNNNQLGQAQYYDGLYKSELANIRIATNRAKGV
jgi:hypothetical protein